MSWLHRFFGINDPSRCQGVCKQLKEAQELNEQAVNNLTLLLQNTVVVPHEV